MVLFLVLDEVEDVFGDLPDGLDELVLAGIALFDALNEAGQINVIRDGPCRFFLADQKFGELTLQLEPLDPLGPPGLWMEPP